MIGALDTGALVELVWAAPAAALLVTIAMGLVVRGSTHAYEAARDGHNLRAAANATLAVFGGLVFAAAVVAGLVIMTSK